MRRASRIALLVAAVALPLAVVLGSYALTGGGRTPQVPEQVRIGDHPDPTTRTPRPSGPDTASPSPGPTSPPAPPPDDDRGDLPPPPPVDDDDADDHDDRRDDD